MKTPRIFIHMHYLEMGGAEKALIGLLEAIDKDAYDVDLFLNQHTGCYMDLIPDGINLLPEIPEYAAIEQPLSYSLKKLNIKSIINKFKCRKNLGNYLKKHPGNNAVASHIYMDSLIETLPDLHKFGQYDLAVSFLDPPHIVQDKVIAKKKVEWIHTDFAAIKYDSELTYSRWAQNDYIVSISDAITESFTSVFPSLSHKITLIENIISTEYIKREARKSESNTNNDQTLNICSIGRINAEQKNFKIIPKVVALLKEKGISVKWRIIGPGDSSELQQLIQGYNVQDEVELTGPMTNPYPVISSCDIYIQPSIYEGKSIAVREAQILCKPVIITNYPTSTSQVIDKVDGIICGMSTEDITEAIIKLSQDANLQQQIKMHLSNHDYGLKDEVQKFIKLIN